MDRLVVELSAWPDPSLEYFIVSDRCPAIEAFSTFRTPEGFFDTTVARQIAVLREAITADLRDFARECGYPVDSVPFVDDGFDRFYLDFGDGWWFDQRGGFRLWPDAQSDRQGTP